MLPVLEAVPNFSEGRDLGRVRALVAAIEGEGADVLDWSADPDHHRSVVTLVGDPATVERAVVAAARLAAEIIDLREHRGVHPRVGALDVLPLVPLQGLTLDDAVASARRVGRRIADAGLPVYWYAAASPSGRGLAAIRRGGFEALSGELPAERIPDLRPEGMEGLHPTAGAVCVGARRLLLAWNLYVEGVEMEELRGLAASIRERGGGFRSLRALALELPAAGRRQISMNLEELDATSPFEVYRVVEERVGALGGRLTGTEVIGMIPDALVLPAATDRLGLLDSPPSRLLSARVAEHVSGRASRAFQALLDAVTDAGEACPPAVRDAAERVRTATRIQPTPGEHP